MVLLFTLSVIRHLVLSVATTRNGFWTWTSSKRHCGLGQEVAHKFNAGKNQVVIFNQSNNTGAIDMKTDGSVSDEKSSFIMLQLTFSSKLDWGSCIIFIAKTASMKFRALIHSMKFLSPEVFSQGFIQAILMSGRWYKKLNLLIEFSNSIFVKFYFETYQNKSALSWHST